MPDFASALYLGFSHASHALRPWRALTTGAPAALAEPRLARTVAQDLAELQGCERATLAASTLHAFWDLFGVLGTHDTAVLLDAGVYPVARWGAERPAKHGAVVQTFRHHDVGSLEQLLDAVCRRGLRPIVIADGFCPTCGRAAPVRELTTVTRRFGGLVVLDDTQAFGVLGHSVGTAAPMGKEGGGMLQHSQTFGGDVVLVCSMAKAFGVPLAVLSGSRELVARYERHSETRMHCSPPSIAALHAAQNALMLNRSRGDIVRLRLARLISRFRSGAVDSGLAVDGGLFPVQSFGALSFNGIRAVYMRLLRSGLRAVLTQSRHDSSARVSFLVTARHTIADIDRAVELLAEAVRSVPRPAQALGVEHGMRMRKLS